MTNECKYRLPCGWCDTRNIMCDHIHTGVATTVTRTERTRLDDQYAETAVSSSSYPKRCKFCDEGTPIVHVSGGPINYLCNRDCSVHPGDHICDKDYIVGTNNSNAVEARSNES